MYFLLFLLFFLQPTPSQTLSSPYTSYKLEKTCGVDGSKQSLHLNSQAAVFTFNSTNMRKLDCHLELHLHSKSLGFSVFIETLKIESSSGCSRDFLQFGRDKFVITTHLSDRYCDTVEHSLNVTDEGGALVGYDFRGTSYSRREYIEIHDVEMDIWLELEPSQKNQIKEVKLVVASFLKSCGRDDEEYYKMCLDTNRCFRRQLFCAGIVKCAVFTPEERNRFCMKKTESGGFTYLSVIIIVTVAFIITVTFLGFVMKVLLSHFSNDDTPVSEASNTQNAISPMPCHLSPERDQRRPSSQEVPLDLHPPHLPANPPSYDEVVALGYKDDPPKYSEVAQVQE